MPRTGRTGRRAARAAHSNDMDDDEDGVIKGASNAGRDDEELRDDEIAELDCDDSSGSEAADFGARKNQGNRHGSRESKQEDEAMSSGSEL